MAHIVLFYKLTALFFILASFNIPLFIFFKTKDKFLGHYIFFIAPFIIDSVLSFLLTYMHYNFQSEHLRIFSVIKYIKEYIFIAILFSVVFFCNYIYSVKNKNLKNICLSVICAFLMILIPFTMTISRQDNNLLIKYNSLGNISIFIFILLLIYCFIIGLLNYRKIKNINIRKIVKAIIILTALFFPGILYDLYRNIVLYEYSYVYSKSGEFHKYIYIYPISYVLISFISTYYIIKYYFKEYSIVYSNSLKEKFENYKLSKREIEVFKLIANGKSNKEIGKALFISINTVKIYTKNIFKKLNIKKRYELFNFIKNNE